MSTSELHSAQNLLTADRGHIISYLHTHIQAYDDVEKVAKAAGKLEEFKAELGREIMRHSCKPNLREVVVKRLQRS